MTDDRDHGITRRGFVVALVCVPSSARAFDGTGALTSDPSALAAPSPSPARALLGPPAAPMSTARADAPAIIRRRNPAVP